MTDQSRSPISAEWIDAIERGDITSTDHKVIAQHLREAADLRQQLAKAKQIPMRYRRMEFNAQLQQENADLRERLAKAREEARNQARESLSVIEAILKSLTHPTSPTATEWVELRGIARAHLATIEAQKGADHE